MNFKDRNIKVILSKEAKSVYIELNQLVINELSLDIKSSEYQTLFRSIKRISERLKHNPFAGKQVEKKKIPKKYIKEFEITNLWRIELSNYWRLIYTIKSDKVEIINFVLDIVNHKKYNKIFGYKKR